MTEPDEAGAAARARVDIRVQVLDDLRHAGANVSAAGGDDGRRACTSLNFSLVLL